MAPKEPAGVQTITHPLEPVYRADSKLLILGSFPSVKTREYGFFYGHPANRFWPLMAALFQENVPADIQERRDFLLRHKIAVYDSIYQCDIVGSSDASIQHVIPTDLQRIFPLPIFAGFFVTGQRPIFIIRSIMRKTVEFRESNSLLPALPTPSIAWPICWRNGK